MKKLIIVTILFCLFFSCKHSEKTPDTTATEKTSSDVITQVERHPITIAAKDQIGKTTSYDPAYVGLDYPNGDLPIEKGVCTDVIIRALRKAYQMDLQKLIHEDMKKNFSKYPKLWGLTRPDKNIDHRRVPNIKKFFERKGYKVDSQKSQFLDGDILTCIVGSKLAHIMIVSQDEKKRLRVIHNIGNGTQETDDISTYKITGHYRIKKK